MSDEHISTTPTSTGKPRCPACEGRIATTPGTHCEQCHAPLSPALAHRAGDQTRHLPSICLQAPTALNPGLVGLGWVTLLLSLVFFPCVGSPGVLFVILALGLPAVIRAVRMVSLDTQRGARSGDAFFFSTFVASYGVVFLLGIAAGVAFSTVCGTVEQLNPRNRGPLYSSDRAVVAGLLAGGAAFLVLYALAWPRRRGPQDPRPKAERDAD